MAKWDVHIEPDGEVRVSHHHEGKTVHADVDTDEHGKRHAECSECHTIVTLDRGAEESASAS